MSKASLCSLHYCWDTKRILFIRHVVERSNVFPHISLWPNFVCELCTVRCVINRELGRPGDLWLMQLERIRLLDMVHKWPTGTVANY